MDATKLILGISFKERAIFAQGYQSVLGLRRFVVFCCIYWEGVLRWTFCVWSWLVEFCLSTGEFKRTCAASLGFSGSWKFPEISFSSLFFILGPWPRDKYTPKRTQEKWKAPSTLIYTMSIDMCVVLEPMQWAVVEGLCSYVLPGTIEILLQLNQTINVNNCNWYVLLSALFPIYAAIRFLCVSTKDLQSLLRPML